MFMAMDPRLHGDDDLLQISPFAKIAKAVIVLDYD
jgi:hypothetical protein